MQLQVIKRIDHSLRKIKVKLTRKKKKKKLSSEYPCSKFFEGHAKIQHKGFFFFFFIKKKRKKEKKSRERIHGGCSRNVFHSGIRKVEGFFFHKG